MRNWLGRNLEKENSVFDKEGRPVYGLWQNNMFFRIWNKSELLKGSASRLRWAALFGSQLVFDLSWDEHMSEKECREVVRQLRDAYHLNRYSPNPFNLWFVNVVPGSRMEQILYDAWVTLKTKDHFINITSKHYLELFDRRRLVYLTYDSQNEMTTFDTHLVYVIAGFLLGRKERGPLVVKRAKQEMIGFLKLPINRYVQISRKGWGWRNLHLKNIVNILTKVKDGSSWKDAFIAGIPPFKLSVSNYDQPSPEDLEPFVVKFGKGKGGREKFKLKKQSKIGIGSISSKILNET